MGKKTFIPNWYIDKKIQRRNKKNKICIIVISIVNIALLGCILSNSNKVKNIEQELGKENNNSGVIMEAFKPDIIAVYKYKEFSDFFEENNIMYKNMIITKENLEIDIEVENYEEYIHVIRCIENSYSIKHLTPKIKNEGNLDFKVILEV